MDDASERAELAARVAGRRRELGGRGTADPRMRTFTPRAAKPSSPWALLLLALLGAVALVACATLAIGVVWGGSWLRGALNDPTSTTQSFLSAVQTRNYGQAYTLLSQNARRQQSESAFEGQFLGYDAIQGPVSDYSLSSPSYSKNGAVASITVLLHRKSSETTQQNLTVTLVMEGGNWRIATIAVRSQAFASGPSH
jgi:hypothetical protein